MKTHHAVNGVDEVIRLKAELATLRQEKESFYMDYRIKTDEQLKAAHAELDALRQVCRNVYEVWAGSEGIPEPTTCSEAYLLSLVFAMRDEAKKGLK